MCNEHSKIHVELGGVSASLNVVSILAFTAMCLSRRDYSPLFISSFGKPYDHSSSSYCDLFGHGHFLSAWLADEEAHYAEIIQEWPELWGPRDNAVDL